MHGTGKGLKLVARISRILKLDKTSILFPADSIAKLVEQQSGYPKMRVRIPLKSTFLVDFSSVGSINGFISHKFCNSHYLTIPGTSSGNDSSDVNVVFCRGTTFAIGTAL